MLHGLIRALALLAMLLVASLASAESTGDGEAPRPAEAIDPIEDVDASESSDDAFDEDVDDDFDDFADDFDALLDEEEEVPGSEGFPDPLEGANRKILRFNQGAHKWILDPVSRSYAFIMPKPARFAIRRFFENLNGPVTLVNDTLQLEWKDAGLTLGALAVNSTIGFFGFFAPGEQLGLPRHRSDFGQTLALADLQSGPYIVIPIMGPTNLRDGTGKIVDLFMRPASWFLGFGVISIVSGTSEGIVTLESHHLELKELENSSVDFYPVLRSAYYQNRMGEIWGRREHRRP